MLNNQVNNHADLVSKKIKQDKKAHIITTILSWLFSLVFFALIIFIVYKSVPGFQEYGWNIFFSTEFDIENKKASVWLPLLITIITSFIAIIFAAPIGLKTAIFIKYRIPKKYQKATRVVIEVLADIPSVIFGLFAIQILSVVVKNFLGMSNGYSLATAGFMLSFMVLPTIVSLSLNALDLTSNDLINASMALGNSKTRSIYKIINKEIRQQVVVAIIIALSRAIGETMAVSMILQSQGYNNTIDQGIWSILGSGLRSLGVLISANMFAESGGEAFKGLLFAFGIFLFIFAMILNTIAMKFTKPKNRQKHSWWNRLENQIANFVLFVPRQLNMLWEHLTYRKRLRSIRLMSSYVTKRVENNRFINFYTWWKVGWEIFSILVVGLFLSALLVNIIGIGAQAAFSSYASSMSVAKDTTGQALINTILIILISICVGLPLSLAIAIYLNEFAKNKKVKSTLLFFIDSLGATPSILFGMFGLIFFIQTLQMSSGGAAGKSLIAGALTILIVILPTFIRTIQQTLNSVPQELRINSYALGAGKWETIIKIVLPAAWFGITTSVVLSIGRILAETAPLYLTSGLAASSSIALTEEGQTLTTRIYAQIYTADINQANAVMYECAFITLLLVLLIIFFAHILIPYLFNKKQERLKKRYADLGKKDGTGFAGRIYKIIYASRKERKEIFNRFSLKNLYFSLIKWNQQLYCH